MTMDVPEKRRIEIKNILNSNQSISVGNLSRLFKVSEITIRRDLTKLDEEGSLEKVHGGAIAKTFKEEYHPIYIEDIKQNKGKKERIAREAVKLISDGSSIILESGTTCLEIVYNLSERKNLAIFTASVPIAYELWRITLGRNDFEVNICGGLIEAKSNTLIGSPAVQYFNNISADITFMGAVAVSVEQGYVTTSSQLDADVTRAIVKNSRRIILVTDSSKFSQNAHIKVFPLSVLESIVTDSGIDKKTANAIKKIGLKLIIA
jgi:DeoR/GlpR family transcriptional regulator of sugar metabolism